MRKRRSSELTQILEVNIHQVKNLRVSNPVVNAGTQLPAFPRIITVHRILPECLRRAVLLSLPLHNANHAIAGRHAGRHPQVWEDDGDGFL